MCSPRPIFFVFLRLVIIFVRRRLRLVSRCGGLLPGLPGWQLSGQTAQEPAGPGIGRGGDGRRGWRRSGCGRQPFGQPPDPDAVEVLLKLHCHAVPYIVRIRWIVEKGKRRFNIHTHVSHTSRSTRNKNHDLSSHHKRRSLSVSTFCSVAAGAVGPCSFVSAQRLGSCFRCDFCVKEAAQI